MLALTVTQPFADYAVGTSITDKDEMKAAVASNPSCVVRTKIEDPDKTEAKAPSASSAKKSDGSA